MSEKMKLKILRVEDTKTTTGKEIWRAYAEGHNGYFSCWTSRIKDYIGKEQEFDVDKKEMQGQNGPWYAYTIKLEKDVGQGGGWKGGGGGWKGKSVTEIVTTAKTMTLAYVKDLAVSRTTSSSTQMVSWDTMLSEVETGYKRLIKLLDLESIKEEPKTAPQEATGNKPATHTLAPALIAILEKKMKAKNFRAADMVDFAGMCSVELKYDKVNDTIIWDIDETTAKELINAL